MLGNTESISSYPQHKDISGSTTGWQPKFSGVFFFQAVKVKFSWCDQFFPPGESSMHIL